MSINSSKVKINLQHEVEDRLEYHGAITSVKADVLLSGEKVGYIHSSIVNRKLIPEGCFWSTFRVYSDSLQRVGWALMEPRLGRTRLKSLAAYDDPKFDFMLIEKFCMTPKYKKNSDLSTIALRKFLHHPFIKGNLNNDNWKVSSVAFKIDTCEAMTPDERKQREKHEADSERLDEIRRLGQLTPEMQTNAEEAMRWDIRLDTLAQQCAIPFLRNGFFQDQAIMSEDCSHSWFLVASKEHFSQPIQPEKDVATIQLLPQIDPFRTGKDCELNLYTIQVCGRCSETEISRTNKPSIATIKQQIRTLVDDGASVSRCGALHIACKANDLEIVQELLEIDLNAINTFDVGQCTPLMIAACRVAHTPPYHGIIDTKVIDLLLSKGADKELKDRAGMTAYGRFVEANKWLFAALHAMTGIPFGYFSAIGSWAEIPLDHMQALQAKFIPHSGLSEVDLTGVRQGIMDYVEEDNVAMQEDCDSNHFNAVMMCVKMMKFPVKLGSWAEESSVFSEVALTRGNQETIVYEEEEHDAPSVEDLVSDDHDD